MNRGDGVHGSFSKKIENVLKILCFAGLAFVTVACGNAEADQRIWEPEMTDTPPAEEENAINDRFRYEKVDYDLSVLNDLLVYSELCNIVNEPEKNIGKVIRMNGQFALYRNNETNELLYACMITDATACCAQGMEFVPMPDYVYPEDFPRTGKNITITGVFETYEEDGDMYCRLNNATVEK